MRKKILKTLLVFLLVFSGILLVLGAVTHENLPENSRPRNSRSLPAGSDGFLARQLVPQIAANPGLSGIYLLNDSHEAFLARLSLAETAHSSLDIQYYIWRDDISGHLLLQSLYKAAGRGVRVRLLLDDNNTSKIDEILSVVNAHPNIEVRLFNPFMQRNFRLFGYLSDFSRLNHRMHNKSFTADGLVTIIGGRNVGDEYFGLGTGVMFSDLDMIAVGPAARLVEQDFDRYWASNSTYPLENIIDINSEMEFDTRPALNNETRNYLKELAQSEFVHQLRTGNLPLIWVNAQLVSDDPAKALGKSLPDNTVLAHIAPMIRAAEKELVIVSPYFVPTQKGTDLLTKISEKGKQIYILTNSLAATDVVAVHAGYAKYRKQLLSSNIQLFELKPDVTIRIKNHGGIISSSGASLHAKTFIIDGKKLFVGSFNMDPRSAALNTEMGFVFDSPQLATLISDKLKQHQMAYSYAVAQDGHGDLYWQTREYDQIVTLHTEPQSSKIACFAVWLCSLLPIEWLL